MKKIISAGIILLAFCSTSSADTIIFKDGMRIDAAHVWEQNKEVLCEIGGIVFGYPKADVERIVKNGNGGKKADAPIQKVHQEVTVSPERKAAVPQKAKAISKTRTEPVMPEKDTESAKEEAAISVTGSAGPQKKAEIAEAKTSMREPQKVVSEKLAPPPVKEKAIAAKTAGPVPQKQTPPKAAAAERASLPSFKEIINEDDRNAPAYIKLRRVLLVPPGLAKVQIRALLLSHEKKLRNELDDQEANYKLVKIWAYDDYDTADEGAGGWVGMISNGQKTGKLSDDPELVIR